MKENQGADGRGKPPKKGFHLRMPPSMRARIDEAIRKNGRSVNEEIVARIQATLDAEEPPLLAAIERLRESVDELNERLRQK